MKQSIFTLAAVAIACVSWLMLLLNWGHWDHADPRAWGAAAGAVILTWLAVEMVVEWVRA